LHPISSLFQNGINGTTEINSSRFVDESEQSTATHFFFLKIESTHQPDEALFIMTLLIQLPALQKDIFLTEAPESYTCLTQSHCHL
jgi:hypothetical protein